MTLEQAIMTRLLADTDIIAQVGERIYLSRALQDTVKPYIVFFKVSAPRQHSHGGSSHLAQSRIQFSIFATTYKATKDIALLLQASLQGYAGTMGGAGGVLVQGVFYENEYDNYEPETKLFHLAVDYMFWHDD